MNLILLQKLCGWVLVGLLCLGVLTLSGCRDRQAGRNTSDSGSVISGTAVSQTLWRETIAVRPIPGGGETAAGLSGEIGGSPKLHAFDPGMSIIEAERMDRRERARNLAESRNNQARTRMEAASAARFDARRREMQAEHDIRFSEFEGEITAEYVDRVREVDRQLQGEQINLHLKASALKSRQGMFGGQMDSLTNQALARLKEQQEQLDKRRSESVQSAEERRKWQIAEVSRRLQAEMEHNLDVLQVELDNRLEEQSKSLRDRLQAQMSGGGSRGSIASIAQVADVADVPPTSRDLSSAYSQAVGDADQGFEQDLARAVAIARKRLEEARQRKAEDAALVTKNKSGA